jgi:hypothetical protein
MVVHQEFFAIARRVVWCTMVTVDRSSRPRSRIVHPLWELDGASLVGWVVTRPTPLKVAHLAAHPHVSCSYWDQAQDVAIAECDASWAPEAKDHVWALCRSEPPPLGFDPDGLRSAELEPTVLRLDPWRLSAAPMARFTAGEAPLTWTRAEAGGGRPARRQTTPALVE